MRKLPGWYEDALELQARLIVEDGAPGRSGVPRGTPVMEQRQSRTGSPRIPSRVRATPGARRPTWPWKSAESIQAMDINPLRRDWNARPHALRAATAFLQFAKFCLQQARDSARLTCGDAGRI